MQDFEKLGIFYLGRRHDAAAKKPVDDLLLYESKDLVTHAVVVGMTGSGKTGLCISLLEEAAIDGIPALIIDPKGDMGNLLLQFPDLAPADFEPWVNEDEARSQGVPVPEFAAKQAELWRNGLAKWGEDGARIARLKESADFAIYTPGSSAGLQLSILKSFDPPSQAILDDAEAMRDRIGNTATAVLSLIGIDAEPLKSRERILISAILDQAWRNGKSLDLAGLIAQIQNPPMQKVGVMDLESFFPAKDRFQLAMAINNLLASPGFETWLQGDALDIGALLRTSAGKPRVSVISVAHLPDAERMFFVAMLLNEILSWTRQQSGTTSLRAIVYMDEIFGYFPPTANPPSKRPLLTLLKQARAFGIGVVLATQNPVDLDYKGLANTGTWFIGRLQTERDKQRLMDGLEGANLDKAAIGELLAGLGQRVFLMNNVHDPAPVVFESRWALSYLRGPLTQPQVKSLMSGKAQPAKATAKPKPATITPAERVVLPPGVPQKFIPVRGSLEGVVYQPAILGAADIRFVDAKSKIDASQRAVFTTPIKDDSLPVDWQDATEIDVDAADLEDNGADGAAYGAVPTAATNVKSYPAWSKDFVTWLYGNRTLDIYRSPSTGLCSNVGESEADFRSRISQQAREKRDAAVEQLRLKYAPKLQTLQDRLLRAQQATEREKNQAQQQTLSAVLSAGTSILGAFLGRKTLSRTTLTSVGTAARRAGMAYKESQDVQRATESAENVQQQLTDLQAQWKADTDELQAKIDPATETLETIQVKPKKTNISVRLLTLAWAPYRKSGEGAMEPAW
jgi:hypothetical protein